jgi:hypothetical protein
MYSGKIAVPSGGGGIRKKKYIKYRIVSVCPVNNFLNLNKILVFQKISEIGKTLPIGVLL